MPADTAVAIAGDRIMIVEDEPLVAMAMSELMTELGLTVVGPFGKVGQAIAALKDNSINAALLDINLAGELVYPLADMLIADNVPFVFVRAMAARASIGAMPTSACCRSRSNATCCRAFSPAPRQRSRNLQKPKPPASGRRWRAKPEPV